MKMTDNDEVLKTEKIKKVKKLKKDDVPKETKTKTEKMVVEMPDNNELKKKKKKRKLTPDPENVTADAGVEVCKKKEIVEKHNNFEGDDQPVKKKKKKIKNESVETKSNNCIIIIEDDIDQSVDVEKAPKKANKVKKHMVTNTKETKKKDAKKAKSLTEEYILVTETVATKRSIKKKSKLPENAVKIEPESDQVENGIVKKKKRKDKNIAEEKKEIKNNGNEESKESGPVKKTKRKKSKSEKEIETNVDRKLNKTAQDSFNTAENPKPKKKKEKHSKGDKEPLLVESEVEAADKSKRKSSKKVEREVDAEPGSKRKKKKIKEEQVDHEESSHVEVVFLSEKAGNTDEVNVNKERRQALQMEIDQASQPKKPAKHLGLGQWSTAEFGSSEQQQKFLRLMGGFKKGFQPASSSGGGGNMALGKDAQQRLQQGLLGEFERAHSRRMDFSNKGAGLGFTAPSTKKFSIDANATRSIRFDD